MKTKARTIKVDTTEYVNTWGHEPKRGAEGNWYFKLVLDYGYQTQIVTDNAHGTMAQVRDFLIGTHGPKSIISMTVLP